jgi:hypothetical protein
MHQGVAQADDSMRFTPRLGASTWDDQLPFVNRRLTVAAIPVEPSDAVPNDDWPAAMHWIEPPPVGHVKVSAATVVLGWSTLMYEPSSYWKTSGVTFSMVTDTPVAWSEVGYGDADEPTPTNGEPNWVSCPIVTV